MRTLIIAVILVTFGVLAACNTPAGEEKIADNSPQVATFEGGVITQAEVEAFLASINERQRVRFKTPEGRTDMLERMALNKALAASAKEAGFGDTVRDKLAMKQATDGYLAQRLVLDIRESAADEEASRAYYQEHIDDYKKEQVEASHILIKDEGKAKQAKKRVDADEDFATLAKELSEDRASKVKGGSLGYFNRGRMAPEFEEAAFGAELGSVVGPIKTRFGWHIIKVTGKREEIPFEEVEKRIVRTLERDSITAYMDEKKEILNVVVDEAAVEAIDPEAI